MNRRKGKCKYVKKLKIQLKDKEQIKIVISLQTKYGQVELIELIGHFWTLFGQFLFIQFHNKFNPVEQGSSSER